MIVPSQRHLWFFFKEIYCMGLVTELLRKDLLLALLHLLSTSADATIDPAMLWEETQGVPNSNYSLSVRVPRTLRCISMVLTHRSDLVLTHICISQATMCLAWVQVSLNRAHSPSHYHFHLCMRSKKLKQVGCCTFTGIIHHKMRTEKNGMLTILFMQTLFEW